MTRELKVYYWMDFARKATYEERPWVRQIDCIVAAHSKAEVARLAGYDRPAQMFNFGETGNTFDIALARSEPLTIFWTWIDERYPKIYKKWEDH